MSQNCRGVRAGWPASASAATSHGRTDCGSRFTRTTWRTEPLFHISSPFEGWDGPKPERHNDYIDPADFPCEWLGWPLTVEVEVEAKAKGKELAVLRLLGEIRSSL